MRHLLTNKNVKWFNAALALLMLGVMIAGCTPQTTEQKSDDSNSPPQTFKGKSQLSEEDYALVVATVDGKEITLGEFERRINSQSQALRSRYGTLERKKEFLKNMIRFELLFNEAERQGFDQHPAVLMEMKQEMVRLMMKDLTLDQIKMSDITEEDINAYYKEHYDEYNQQPQIRVSHILLETQEEANTKHKELVEEISKEPIKARRIFGQYARTASKDQKTAKKSGDLGYLTRGNPEKIDAEIVKQAFTSKKFGDVIPPFKGEAGYHIIMRTGSSPARSRSLEDAHDDIQNLIYRERRNKHQEAFVKQIRKNAKIEINEELLNKIKPPVLKTKPKGIANPLKGKKKFIIPKKKLKNQPPINPELKKTPPKQDPKVIPKKPEPKKTDLNK